MIAHALYNIIDETWFVAGGSKYWQCELSSFSCFKQLISDDTKIITFYDDFFSIDYLNEKIEGLSVWVVPVNMRMNGFCEWEIEPDFRMAYRVEKL